MGVENIAFFNRKMQFPRTIVRATLRDGSVPRKPCSPEQVTIYGATPAESYSLKVNSEVLVSSPESDDPFVALLTGLHFNPSISPHWTFTARWFYKIKEVQHDLVKKNLGKVRRSQKLHHGQVTRNLRPLTHICSTHLVSRMQHPRNIVFLSAHCDSNAIDTIISPCSVSYVVGWMAAVPDPKILPASDEDSYTSLFCCGLYDATAKVVSPLQPDIAELADKTVIHAIPIARKWRGVFVWVYV